MKKKEKKLTIEPATHGGVQRQIENFNEDIAVCEIGFRRSGCHFLVESLTRDNVTLGALSEHNLKIVYSHCVDAYCIAVIRGLGEGGEWSDDVVG